MLEKRNSKTENSSYILNQMFFFIQKFKMYRRFVFKKKISKDDFYLLMAAAGFNIELISQTVILTVLK